MKRLSICYFLLIFASVAGVACGPPAYTYRPPESFKQYEKSREFKFITANGVMLKAREVENYPHAELAFWTDALRRHLESRGYILKAQNQFTTTAGQETCTLSFVLPHGAEDWVLSETIFVVDDTIVLLEAAGPFDQFVKIEKEYEESLKTFDPRI